MNRVLAKIEEKPTQKHDIAFMFNGEGDHHHALSLVCDGIAPMTQYL